jgi:acyl phosphate:glycerol-3-phosphate acyltransferase
MSLSAEAVPLLLALVLAFLLGSVPFGLILTHVAGLGDIRRIGSGNIGATNVLRTGRRGLAAATLLLDLGKGVAAVLVARHWGGDVALAAALAVVLGHMFPPWLGFNGGKGVATSAGVLLALAWPVGLAVGVTWLAVVLATRYSSLAAIVAAALAPVYAWLVTGAGGIFAVSLIVTILVLARHRDNALRLMRGEESRIGHK